MKRRAPVVAGVMLCVGLALGMWGGAGTVSAQTTGGDVEDGTSDDGPTGGTDEIVAVLEGPGGVGYWLVSSNGEVETVGTSILPALGEDPDIPVRVESARAGSPGALGLWLQLADGTEVAVGDPGPELDLREERSLGWLAGTAIQQLLDGAWWPDIDLACTAELPRAVRIGQTIMPILAEREFGLAVEEARDHQIGGIMLIGGATPFIDLRIEEVQGFAGRIPLMFAVDEEGGRVQRLRGVLPTLEAAADQADDRLDVVQARALRHGEAMADLGFTVNFAPVFDVGAGPGIGDRAISDDPGVVAAVGMAMVAGFHEAGVLPVVKHFPGHGSASADSHVELPTTPSIDELRDRDLVPFVTAVGDRRAAVMVGHLDVPGLTNGVPASVSPAAISGLLRGEMGHDGLVITDALVMQAIADRWTIPEAVVLALAAGADLALIGGLDDIPLAFDAVDRAVLDGTLSVEQLNLAATRVLRAKGINACTLVGRVRGTLNTIRDR